MQRNLPCDQRKTNPKPFLRANTHWRRFGGGAKLRHLVGILRPIEADEATITGNPEILQKTGKSSVNIADKEKQIQSRS